MLSLQSSNCLATEAGYGLFLRPVLAACINAFAVLFVPAAFWTQPFSFVSKFARGARAFLHPQSRCALSPGALPKPFHTTRAAGAPIPHAQRRHAFAALPI